MFNQSIFSSFSSFSLEDVIKKWTNVHDRFKNSDIQITIHSKPEKRGESLRLRSWKEQMLDVAVVQLFILSVGCSAPRCDTQTPNYLSATVNDCVCLCMRGGGVCKCQCECEYLCVCLSVLQCKIRVCVCVCFFFSHFSPELPNSPTPDVWPCSISHITVEMELKQCCLLADVQSANVTLNSTVCLY